ncbi:hypothetical protein HP456_08765 [Bacillus haikouensis]|uniref:hypothetical protein n=1 Tax=Bacillus haikouensis TaxID=1510468 RepID=UPI001553EE3A|nr:hypothetical protein [Bacillus haikouensis]NQD66015.1 hypothetical protein [Bacillus haikouensis]
MDILRWMSVGFIILGFFVLISIKRTIESKETRNVQTVIWWIWGTAVWGTASIILIVWCFHSI